VDGNKETGHRPNKEIIIIKSERSEDGDGTSFITTEEMKKMWKE